MAVGFSFLQTNSDGTNLTTYTFAGENFGTAPADRQIIVAIGSQGAGETAESISSVTIGGVSATITVQRTNSIVDHTISGLAIANVPTGTTGDIVITLSTGERRCGIGVYRATGISAIPTDTGSSIANNPTFDIDVIAGGFAIGTAGTGFFDTATWTNLTEDYDFQAGGESFALSGASDVFGSEQTDLTLLCTWAASLNAAGVFASWEGSEEVAAGFMTSYKYWGA